MPTELMTEIEAGEQPYTVRVQKFEGPLDVLWDLIKRSKIDITEVSIFEITEQYMDYLKLMERMNMHVTSNFIWMASELLYYKSRALLPSDGIEDEYFTPPLPPELIQKLLEYKKFQRMSLDLKDAYERQANTFTRHNIIEGMQEITYSSLSLFDLLKAFAKVMDAQNDMEQEELVFDEIEIKDRIDYIISLLKEKESVVFVKIFSARPSRAEFLASFLAILELSKASLVKIVQEQFFGDILLIRSFPSNQISQINGLEIS